MPRIAEEPRARAIRHHHEGIVGYLVCHHRSPALFRCSIMGVFAQPLALVHEGRSHVLVALRGMLEPMLATLTPRECRTDLGLLVGPFPALSYKASEEARPTARLSDQDARTVAGFRPLLASLHDGP